MENGDTQRTVTYNDIPVYVVSQMAKFLDTNGESNWEALADWYGLRPIDIQVSRCCRAVLLVSVLIGVYFP